MKRFLTAILLLLGPAAFAENTQVLITPGQPHHAGYVFTVAAVRIDHGPESPPEFPQVYRVVICVTPPPKSASPHKACVEIGEGKDYLFSTEINSCEAKDIPFEFRFRHLNASKDALLFQFSMSRKGITNSSFSYQIPRKDETSEPVDCVINLRDFIKLGDKVHH